MKQHNSRILSNKILIIKVFGSKWWVSSQSLLYKWSPYLLLASLYSSWTNELLLTDIKEITILISQTICPLYKIHKILDRFGNNVILRHYVKHLIKTSSSISIRCSSLFSLPISKKTLVLFFCSENQQSISFSSPLLSHIALGFFWIFWRSFAR